MVRELLFNDGGRNLNDETREKLQFLNTTTNGRNSTLLKDHLHDKLVNCYIFLSSFYLKNYYLF